MERLWYYGRGSEQSGPMSLDDLRTKLGQDGNLSEALVWREGFENWRQAPEVAELYPAMPPPLPKAPTAFGSSEVGSPQSGESNAISRQSGGGWKKGAGVEASIGGAVVGLALSKALGSVFWIPALSTCAAWWALSKGKAPAWAIPMLAIVIGQTIWVAIGVSILLSLGIAANEHILSLIDVVIVGALTVWVLKSKSLASCVGVLLFELLALAINVTTASGQSNTIAVAMAMHVVLRLSGIIACGYAIHKRRAAQVSLIDAPKLG